MNSREVEVTPELLDNLGKAFRNGIADPDYRNRAAILDVLSLIADPASFEPIIRDVLEMIRYNYYHGNEEQRAHVGFVLNYLLRENLPDENSQYQSDYHPPT